MKIDRILKIVSLISYSLIILKGQMIGIPLLLWLIFTSFEFGHTEQVYAILGILGLVFVCTKYWNIRLVRVLSFALLMIPIFKRLSETPLEKFNYLGFHIPLWIFITTYLILIIKPRKE